jgi:lysozyme family protein
VNAGIWRSARLLQRALRFSGEEVDGCVGPETLDAAAKCDPRILVADLAERQVAYYRSLADFPIFGAGWLDRTEARRSAALVMIAARNKNLCSLDAFCNNVCVVFPAARGNRAAVNIFGY